MAEEKQVNEPDAVTEALRTYAEWLSTFSHQGFFGHTDDYSSKRDIHFSASAKVPAELRSIVKDAVSAMGWAWSIAEGMQLRKLTGYQIAAAQIEPTEIG